MLFEQSIMDLELLGYHFVIMQSNFIKISIKSRRRLTYLSAKANFSRLLTNVILMSLQLFFTEIVNNYQSLFIIQAFDLISKFNLRMFGRQIMNQDAAKQKHRKDFLYKIGKLRQNRILQNKQNLIEYHQEEQKKQPGESQQCDEQQLSFDMVVPFTQQFQTTTVKFQKSINEKSQVKSLELEQKNKQDQEVQRIQIQRQQTITSHKKEEKQETDWSNSQLLTINGKEAHKPFTFEDIQDQENEHQNVFKQQIQVNQKDIQNNQIKKQEQKIVSLDQQDSQSSEVESQIKGMSIMSSSLQGNVIIKITNKKQLILSRLPPGIILKCIIRKSSDIFNPQFDFYLNNGLKHIISAKKFSLAKKQIFKLSLQLGKYKQKDIIASIMANTVHNIYWVYQQELIKEEVNYQLKAIVKYQKMIKPAHRQMRVHVFIHDQNPIIVEYQKLAQQLPIQKGLILKNCQLQPKQSSIKNYSLYDEQDKQYQYLKMAKISENMFEVSIQHPLSPMQAFCVCLTRFDAQLK